MNRNIGDKIKHILSQKSLTIEDLLNRTSLRKDQLDIILSNSFTPPLTMLKRIAEGLEVTLNMLMDGTEDAELAICRGGERREGISFSASEKPNSAFKFFSLAGSKANRAMEPFILELCKDNSNIEKISTHEGEEFIFVVEGSIELLYGDTTTTLEKGDSVYFDSVVPHTLKSLTESATLLCMTNSPA